MRRSPGPVAPACKVPKSTRGREVLNRFLEDVVGWLQDNYAPPVEALDPNSFKLRRDTVMDGPDNYIDYLVTKGILNKILCRYTKTSTVLCSVRQWAGQSGRLAAIIPMASCAGGVRTARLPKSSSL
jgi:hypothetical protein